MCVNVNHVHAFFLNFEKFLTLLQRRAAGYMYVRILSLGKGIFFCKAVEACWRQRCAMLTKKRMARFAKEVGSTSSDTCIAVCLIALQAAKDN